MTTAGSIKGRPLSRRRLLKTLGTGLAAVGFGVPGAAQAQQPSGASRRVSGNMVLATWGGRYSKAMKDFFLGPFSQESGVVAQTVDAPGGFVPMLQAQAKAGNVTWDLVDVGEADSLFLLDNGLIQPLPPDVKADLIGAVGEQHVTDYGISFAAFGWVIAANRKTAKRIPTTPAEFFDVQNVPGRRTMYADDQLTGVLYALQAEGVPRNRLYPPDLDRAYRKLDQVKKSVAVWWKTGDQSQQILRDQEVDMGLLWDGRAAGVIDQGVDLALSFEGTPISRDLLVVPTSAPNAAAASCANARPAAISTTSSERCIARRPRARISFAVCSPFASSSRWQNAMSAPSAANASAVARPMPRDPPVTSAICPASFIAIPPLRRSIRSSRRADRSVPSELHRPTAGTRRAGRGVAAVSRSVRIRRALRC